MKKAQLTNQEILDKEFKTSMRGYNQDEVDEFLDVVIQDYDYFEKEVVRLNEELERLKNATGSNTNSTYQNNQSRSQVNADVLQRLSNLEKAVFGRKRTE
ncbi:DivIVA domain-containing protein [Alkalibacillus filiformis]|uniref:Cell cycle protein GpsB n=3 Tax=Bacillaceae TaxID=186817 RepID=A0A511W226_9BACI|nr:MULTISPECIES: cell division regulator GpsB [Alkalibacillus]MDQ0350818.1 DivIVA domain-containing protein [Alkalibacillus filiformis]MDV2580790.1 cell division regulator GpsB [Alkalibacillus haloalkaliphilus]GEN45116.1 cell cycle protein GpsB [Alkalibacillus haloalkaliphilus]